MNDAIKIQLSAFIDGELPENESELLLRRLSQDAALRKQAAEYLQIGRAMRGEHDLPGMNHLRGRIAAALGEEQVTEVIDSGLKSSRFVRPLAGVAIAASVAVAALVGLRQIGGVGEAGLGDDSADFAAVAIDDSSMYTEPLANNLASDAPSDRVAQYYRQHEQRSAGMGSNILTRLVTLELREGKLVEIEPRVDDIMEDTDSPDDVAESQTN